MEKILFQSGIKFLHPSSTLMASLSCPKRQQQRLEAIKNLLDYEGAEPANRFTVVGGFNIFILEH